MAREWLPGELTGVTVIAGGISLVVLSVGGFFAGLYLDHVLGTGFRFAIIGLVIGALLGFLEMYVLATRIMAQQPPPPPPLDDSEDNGSDEEGYRD